MSNSEAQEVADAVASRLMADGLLQGTDMPSFHLLEEALEAAGPGTPRFSEACDIVNAELRKTVVDIILEEMEGIVSE
jgi:hypothetical protein